MYQEVKYLEIRDAATFIPVVAYKFDTLSKEDNRYLVAIAGYGTSAMEQREEYTIVTKLVGLETHYDASSWGNSRTMFIAHKYIHDNYFTLIDGDVIDVEYILEIKPTQKIPQRLEIE